MKIVSCSAGAAISLSAVVLVAGCSSSPSSSGADSGESPSVAQPSGASGTESATVANPSSANSASPAAAATESNPPGDIPDDVAYVVFTPTTGGFTVKVPEGWERLTTASATVFSDKYNSVRIASAISPDPPTVASVSSTGVAAAQVTSSGFTSPKVTTVDRRAGQAILLTYQADSPLNEVTGKVAVEAVEQYTFWRKGTAVVLTLSAPAGSDNVDPWRAVTDSFSWSA